MSEKGENMSYLVKATLCIEVEEANSEEEAKLAAIDQLSDYFRHNQWVDLLMVEKMEATAPVSQVPDCPNCEEPLTEIWGSDNYKITWEDGRWHKEEDSSRLCCGKCQGDLDDADVEDIMRAVGLL